MTTPANPKARITPADIAVDLKTKNVHIQWQDGVTTSYSLDLLRKNCPCAVCNEARDKHQADPLAVFNSNMVTVTSNLDLDSPVQLVGNYALQFFWADGHRTGIYTYKFLRDLKA